VRKKSGKYGEKAGGNISLSLPVSIDNEVFQTE
jgi:hypothetical protein